MQWNRHSALKGMHALLGASKSHWLRYDDEKLRQYVRSRAAAAEGTRKHALAHMLIQERQKLPDNKKTLNRYVNDGIGYLMHSEQLLFYSEYCFGTADTISFREPKGDRPAYLRISDLKTGESQVKIEQLLVYAAIFFLEYDEHLRELGLTPFDVKTELRIYQHDDVEVWIADPEDLVQIMDRIVSADKYIRDLMEEANAWMR